MTPLPQNPDVAIIGAGTAGLSASKSLREMGLSTIVLEANGHAGGRCVTDVSQFSVPFDRGGSWLHSAEINPLAQIAVDTGSKIHKEPWNWTWVHSLGHDLGPQEVAEYRDYQQALWAIVDDAGGGDIDCTPLSAMPDGAWTRTIRHSIAQMLAGDGDVTSATDSRNYIKAPGDWLVEGGLGNFIHGLFMDEPVVLNCPARRIDYSGPGVVVTTPQGDLNCKFVVVTVSTDVLAAESIKFVPALPPEKTDAFHDLPNGLLNKVGIEFDRSWAGAVQGQMADYHSSEDEFCSILFGFFGGPVATGFVAGRFADALEKEGAGAATDYCLAALRATFGNGVEKHVLATTETAWRQDPFALGSYSYAKLGRSQARSVLAQPVANRVFFGGEASMKNTYSTVHGAYLSGNRVAEEIKSLSKPNS